MRRIKILLATMLFATFCRAADYPYLSFETTGGTITSYAADGLTMTVAGGKLIVTTADGNSSELSLSELSRMFFSSEASAISDVPAGKDAAVSVYPLTGVSRGSFSSMESARRSLQGGVYVVRTDGRTFKMTVK